jgi:MFS family permease
VHPRLIGAFLMMLSVTFGFWGVATFVPTYVGTVATKMGLEAPFYSAVAGLLGTGFSIAGYIILGFLADAIGRRPAAMLYYGMCLDRETYR